jgi:hypothetical protein
MKYQFIYDGNVKGLSEEFEGTYEQAMQRARDLKAQGYTSISLWSDDESSDGPTKEKIMDKDLLKAKVAEIISDLDDWDLLDLHNEYCRANNYYDDEIFDMAMIDDLLYEAKPSKILMMAYYGDFNPNHGYFRFDGYGNLDSFDFLRDVVDCEEIAEFVVEYGNCLSCRELEDKFNELLEEEEE